MKKINNKDIKVCALAVIAGMSAMQANATEMITTDNTVITGNHDNGTGELGGAIYNKAHNTVIRDASFKNNKVVSTNEHKGDGGALRDGSNEENTSITIIENSEFLNNSANIRGGAITIGGANSIIKEGIINTVLEGNKVVTSDVKDADGAGGALYIYEGKIQGQGIKGCTFKNNSALSSGGAVLNYEGEISAINKTTFEGNKAKSGGAISGSGKTGIIKDSVFKNNSATDGYGGAIETRGKIGSIDNTKFEGNTANGYGGAIYLYEGTGDQKADKGQIDSIKNSTFINNKATKKDALTYGGAIYNDGTIKEIDNSTFKGNSANDYNIEKNSSCGGAIANFNTLNTIKNSTFENNSAFEGGAVYNIETLDEISNTTFKGNKAILNGGAYMSNYTDKVTRIINSRFENNTVENTNKREGEFNLTYAQGGAICSNSDLIIENTDFVNNTVKSTNGYADGSAITTFANLKLTDSSFYNNKIFLKDNTDNLAAAITSAATAENSYLDIYAINKNVVFTGNETNIIDSTGKVTSTTQNDIFTNADNLNLNAAPSKSITFDGSVISTKTVNINKDEGYTGEVVFNNVISNDILALYQGTLKVGKYNGDKTTANPTPSNIQSLHIQTHGGTINLANDYIETVSLINLDFENDGDVIIDADLKTNSVDNFNFSHLGGSGKIKIKEVNLMSETDDSTSNLKFLFSPEATADRVVVPTIFTSTNRYDTTTSLQGHNTIITLTKDAGKGGLENMTEFAPASAGSRISYTMTTDEKLNKDLSPFSEKIESVVINGKDHTITGNGKKGFEISAGQDFEIKDVKNITGFKGGNGSVILNNGGLSDISRVAFDNNISSGNGGVIHTSGGTVNITDTSFKNNTAQGGKGGAIYATKAANVIINASTRDVVFENNKAGKENNDIYMDNAKGEDGKLYLNANGDRKISLSGVNGSNYSIIINEKLKNGGVVEFKDKVQNVNGNNAVHLYGGTLKVNKDSYLDNNNLALHGCALDMMNNAVGTMQLNSLSLENTTNLEVDVDLKNRTMDKIVAKALTGNGKLNVDKINAISDSNYKSTTIPFTSAALGNKNLTDRITNSVKEIKGPIYKYTVTGAKNGNEYDFTFTNKDGHGNIEYNPSVYIPTVGAQLGGYANQIALYERGFGSMDMLNSMTKKQREAYMHNNKIAEGEATTIDAGDEIIYSPTNLPVGNRPAIWVKPNAAFEKVQFKDGPEVKNFMYNTLVGGDTGLKDLGAGWSGISNFFGGYIGSNQSFDDIKMYQNGGVFGMSGMLYKNNFFGGLTANIGGSGVEASYDAGRENFGMLTMGAAGKFGYNWGLADGKFVIQPSVTASYSFIKSFSYKNAAGYDVDPKALHGVQVAPGLKLIGNLKNNWQPFASVSFMWNVLDKAKADIEGIGVPGISMKPYLQYSLGVQKTVGKRFTGYAEVMARNIGRTGIGFGLGGRWELGK